MSGLGCAGDPSKTSAESMGDQDEMMAPGGAQEAGAQETGDDPSDPLDMPDRPSQVDPDPVLRERATWCEGALGGSKGARALPLDFGHAHVSYRLFGPRANWLEIDATLVDILAAHELSLEALTHYAERFDDVCALSEAIGPRADRPETQVSASSDGAYVVIEPGVDLPTISGEVDTVVIDVRDTPPHVDLAPMISSLITEPATLGTRSMRRFKGFPSQDEGWTHYESELVDETLSISATGEVARRLIFVTGPRLSPEMATLIGGVRLTHHAWIVGYDIFTAVAESTWSGIDDRGLMWRSSQLFHRDLPWPDVIPADLETAQPLATIREQYDALPELNDLTGREVLRSGMNPYHRAAGEPDAHLSRSALMAGLLIAFGTFDRFYTYFDLVGRDLDQAVLTALERAAEVDEEDRAEMLKIIGRVMYALHDGHGFYSDWGTETFPEGYLIAQLQQVEGLPMVRVSGQEGLDAGDTITAIDGVPAETWYEEAMSHYSASTPGYRFVMATDLSLATLYGPRTLSVRTPTGEAREVSVSPGDYQDTLSIPWGGTLRANGWLSDLGADDLYYINLSGSVTRDDQSYDLMALISNLDASQGLVLDMRDYPDVNYYEFLSVFFERPVSAAIFGHPTWTGPERFEITEEIWSVESFGPAMSPYLGQVVVLTSHKSVSSAEHVCQILRQSDQVTFIGQQTAGTNGTVTQLWLPGQIQLTFTGMQLLNPDGSSFHGTGIIPDIEVVPTAAAFAQDEDPELNAAVEFLRR